MRKDIQQKKNYLIWLNRERDVPVNSNIELIIVFNSELAVAAASSISKYF